MIITSVKLYMHSSSSDLGLKVWKTKGTSSVWSIGQVKMAVLLLQN